MLATACGGAQSEDARSAHRESDPAAHASRSSRETSEPGEADELDALEGEDLADGAGEPAEASEGGRRSYSVGTSGGNLGGRRSSFTPGETRRARRAPRPETLDPEVVDAVIEEHVREVHYCYDREFRHRPDVSGRIVVEATIAPNGRVTDARIAESTIRNSRVDACVLQTFSRFEFPEARAPTRVEHPFTLRHH